MFEEKQLEQLFGTSQLRRQEYVGKLYGFTDRGAKPIEAQEDNLRNLIWEPLSHLLENTGARVTLLTGYRATEESFKQIGQSGTNRSSPRILHLATHGYFFPDPKELNPSTSETDRLPFELSEHPMIRSGIILAGANQVWKGDKPLEGLDDGVLTAYEISQMNLAGTELVVLSACETGLGDIKGNEGVYGLQRAFKIAGVKYLIMSLWKVPDRQTKDFMITFYQYWLDDKMTIPDAFRKTQQEMKERFYYDPYQWAGFVLVE